MSRQRRFIYLPLVGTTLLCLLVSAYLVIRRRFLKPRPSAIVIKHPVETSAEDTLAYWTADKMHNAKATPLPEVNEQNREKRPPHSSRPQ